jgi:hypothetical protein
LIDAATEGFGIRRLIEDTRHSYQLLERRLQWVRAQWLAVVAVIAFITNIVFQLLR